MKAAAKPRRLTTESGGTFPSLFRRSGFARRYLTEQAMEFRVGMEIAIFFRKETLD